MQLEAEQSREMLQEWLLEQTRWDEEREAWAAERSASDARILTLQADLQSLKQAGPGPPLPRGNGAQDTYEAREATEALGMVQQLMSEGHSLGERARENARLIEELEGQSNSVEV